VSKRTKFLLGIGVIAALVIGWQIAAFAGPVGTAQGFEDDDGNLAPNGGTPNFDWNSFAPVTWSPHPATTPTRQTDAKTVSGFQFKGIEDWGDNSSDTSFAGGTKQDTNCPSVGTGKPPNKDDLKRIYLSSKTLPSNGHTFLDLAWVRIPQNTTSSSAHVGFEFNQGSTACPAGSDGLVQRTAGDILIVYDFEGGSSPVVLTLRKWVTAANATCEVGSSKPPCWGVAQNLTTGGFAEGAVNAGTPVQDALTPPALSSTTGTSITEGLGDTEFGEAGIDLTAAGVIPANSCASFGKAYAVSRSSGNSGQAQMKDLVGPANFSITNCASVIIRKQTSPDEDPNTTNFGYTTNVTTNPATTTSPFTLQDDGVKTIQNVVQGSGKTVTEDDPSPGYALTSIDCSASTVPAANRSTNTTTRAVTFSIAGGETLDCTFTNTKQTGALLINKNSTKTGEAVTNAGAVFSYNSSSVTDNGAGDADSDVGVVCVSGLNTGSYTVNETTPPDGYGGASETDQTATVVAGSNCTDNLPPGSAVVTFTNPPLADIQVNFRDGGSGETALEAAGIVCDNATGDTDETPATGWDESDTVTGIEAGATTVTVTCTIPIDP
jgi:hypothetical protein